MLNLRQIKQKNESNHRLQIKDMKEVDFNLHFFFFSGGGCKLVVGGGGGAERGVIGEGGFVFHFSLSMITLHNIKHRHRTLLLSQTHSDLKSIIPIVK